MNNSAVALAVVTKVRNAFPLFILPSKMDRLRPGKAHKEEVIDYFRDVSLVANAFDTYYPEDQEQLADLLSNWSVKALATAQRFKMGKEVLNFVLDIQRRLNTAFAAIQ